MKNVVLISGSLIVVINSISALIFQDYELHKMFFADFSIIFSTGLIYLMYTNKHSDGFKIGYTLLFVLTGLIRFVCAVSSSSEFKNNYAVLTFIIVLSLEIILMLVSNLMRNK
jgi:hypothetical protein